MKANSPLVSVAVFVVASSMTLDASAQTDYLYVHEPQ